MTDETNTASEPKAKKGKKAAPLTDEQRAEHRATHATETRADRQARILALAHGFDGTDDGVQEELPSRPARNTRRFQGHRRVNARR